MTIMKKTVLLGGALALCTGCQVQAVQPSTTLQTQPAMQQQMPTQQFQQPNQMMVQQQLQQAESLRASNAAMMMHRQTMAQIESLKARLTRNERAMIRLDRRMQLLERNELSRMSDNVLDVEPTEEPIQEGFKPMSLKQTVQQPIRPVQAPAQPQQGFRPVTYTQPQQPQMRIAPFARGAAAMRQGFKPVTYTAPQGRTVIGTVQEVQNFHPANVKQPTAASLAPRLPSIADQEKQKRVSDDASVSIWTVQYENGKIWPSREQLAASREVVEALRSGDPLAVFARGKTPATKQFRERVRALSKYLGQVANMDSVPIASMPATHLDGDTIEILTTR